MSVLATLALYCPIQSFAPPPPGTSGSGTAMAFGLAGVVALLLRLASDPGATRSPASPGPAVVVGPRRVIQIVLLATIAWAGLVANVATWLGGGSQLTAFIGVMAVIASSVALARPARDTARLVSWSMLALVLLCAIDLGAPTDHRGGADLSLEALWVLVVAVPALVAAVELPFDSRGRGAQAASAMLARMTARRARAGTGRQSDNRAP